MSTETKSNACDSLNSYKIELNKKLSNNLKYLMEQYGYKQNTLADIMKQHGIYINQGTINKYLNKPETNFIPIAILVKCSEIFEIPMDILVMEDISSLPQNSKNILCKNNSNTSATPQTTPKISTVENDLILDSKNRAFKGYWGTYYCYLFPTLSSETKPLKGKLSLVEKDSVCKLFLKLNTNKKELHSDNYIYKEYEGIIIMSKPLHNCYCILKSDVLSEICFLAFRHIYLNNAPLDCRMAEVLTVSAGESHYPTVHRMFFSREPISEEDLQLILPHLCLNSSDILIKESRLNELQEKKIIPEHVFLQLIQTCKPELFYLFKEDYLRSLLENSLPKNEKKQIQKYISLLREKASSYHYNKVSKKLDNNVRSLLISLGYFSKST